MTESNCIFCQIVAGEMDADIVHSDEHVVAFRDINPQAPTHILVIPREHIPRVDDLEERHADLAGRLFLAAGELAEEEGIEESGYRLVMNTGAGAGQSVFHIHLHLLGGRPLSWPPG